LLSTTTSFNQFAPPKISAGCAPDHRCSFWKNRWGFTNPYV